MSRFTRDEARAAIEALDQKAPDLTLNSRTGDEIALEQAHLEALNLLSAASYEREYGAPAEDDLHGATLAGSGIITADNGVGQWKITAHESGPTRWLAIATLEGEVEAQLDIEDISDLEEIGTAMYVLWGWATVGPSAW